MHAVSLHTHVDNESVVNRLWIQLIYGHSEVAYGYHLLPMDTSSLAIDMSSLDSLDMNHDGDNNKK